MKCPSCKKPVEIGNSVLLVRCPSCNAKFAAEDALPEDDLALGEIPPELMPGSATFDPTAGVVTEDTIADLEDSTEPSVSKPAASAVPGSAPPLKGSWLPPGAKPAGKTVTGAAPAAKPPAKPAAPPAKPPAPAAAKPAVKPPAPAKPAAPPAAAKPAAPAKPPAAKPAAPPVAAKPVAPAKPPAGPAPKPATGAKPAAKPAAPAVAPDPKTRATPGSGNGAPRAPMSADEAARVAAARSAARAQSGPKPAAKPTGPVPVATGTASVRREITVADEPAPTEPLADGKALFDWNASHLSEPSGERPAAGSFDGTAIGPAPQGTVLPDLDDEPPLVAGRTDEQILAGNGSGRTIGGALMDEEDHSASTNVSLDDDFAPAAAPAPQIGPRPGPPSVETTMPPEPRPARKRRSAMPLLIGLGLAILFVAVGIAGAMFGLPWLASHRGGGSATPAPTPTALTHSTSTAPAATPAATAAGTATAEPTPTQVAIVRPTPTRAPVGTPRPTSTRTPRPAATPAVKANEQDLEFLTAKADVLAATGKLAPAKDEYQKVLAMDSSYGPAHYGLANVLDQSGDAKGACREWRTYLVLSPAGKNAGAARKKVAGCK